MKTNTLYTLCAPELRFGHHRRQKQRKHPYENSALVSEMEGARLRNFNAGRRTTPAHAAPADSLKGPSNLLNFVIFAT
jgi:hypothetical protein